MDPIFSTSYKCGATTCLPSLQVVFILSLTTEVLAARIGTFLYMCTIVRNRNHMYMYLLIGSFLLVLVHPLSAVTLAGNE